MIDHKTLPGTDEIFSHRDDDGSCRHFAVGALQRLLIECPHILMPVEVCPEFAAFIREKRGVEQPHLCTLSAERLMEPVIFAADGDVFNEGPTLLIDGHHRYVMLAEMGYTFIMGYVLPRKLWENYLVNLPNDDALFEKLVSKDTVRLRHG